MKIYVFLATIFFSAATAVYINMNDQEVVSKCIANYRINPDVLWREHGKGSYIYDNLSEEQQGCVTGCIYKGFNWLREDGTIDVDALFEVYDDETDEEKAEAAREKAAYIRDIEDCRAAVGKNDCKFFHCLEKKGH